MFFKTRKVRRLEEENEKLKRQIGHMTWEWDKEKVLYDKEAYINQKVEWTIGHLDMRQLRSVHRPMYGLTEEEALEIANKCKEVLLKDGIQSKTSYHWRESEECFVIDVETI